MNRTNEAYTQKITELKSRKHERDQSVLTPCLRKELPHSCGPHFGEEGSSVDATEVRQVSIEVQFVGQNGQPFGLEEDRIKNFINAKGSNLRSIGTMERNLHESKG